MTTPLFNDTAAFVELWEYNNWGCYRCDTYFFQVLPPDVHSKLLIVMYCVFFVAILYGLFLMATDKRLGKQERRAAGKKP